MPYISVREVNDKHELAELKKHSIQHLLSRLTSKTVPASVKDRIAVMVVSKELTTKIEANLSATTQLKSVDLTKLTTQEKQELLTAAISA